jgi:transcriptional regulator with XRE-family HTH domain
MRVAVRNRSRSRNSGGNVPKARAITRDAGSGSPKSRERAPVTAEESHAGSQIISNPRARHTLAQNLRAALISKEWSESELSRRSNVSQKQVNNTCRERTGTGIEVMAELAKALQVPLYQLLIPNHFTADAPPEPTKLDKLIVAYLNATPQERAVIDAAIERNSNARHSRRE